MLLDGDSGGGAVLQGTVAVDPPSIAKASTTNIDVGVAGITTGHKIFAQCQSDLETGLACVATYCPANGTLRLRISNWSSSAIDGAQRAWAYQAYP
ncbi:hypothetical protein Dform_01740 [Dehalogenimonas formicexedens]|uniref:Uncharacterized protein n=2 Tax=Dehalogenimonas formicexedens TaxID=1839801 RepID=A0A1P8F9B3_9CHLR|nr:hypothetical protein Dform_01740 [Dehalogenimonas formicexedens]